MIDKVAEVLRLSRLMCPSLSSLLESSYEEALR